MKPRLRATRAARELIKAYEPFKPDAVQRGRRWVVGYGHTAAAKAGVSVGRDEAELLLVYDVAQAEAAVKAVTGDDLPIASRDALISFAASIGVGAFKVSDVARLARAGRHDDAARAMESWVRAEEGGRLVVSERLQRRRRAEKTLYLEGFTGSTAHADSKDEPPMGPLVEVDIAFEDPEPVSQDEIPDPQAVIAAPDPEQPVEDIEPEPVTEAADAPVEARDAPASKAASAAEAPDRKAEQDAVINSVMARMAGDIAASIAAPASDPAGENEAGRDAAPATDPGARPDYSNTRLGYSYMAANTVSAPLADEAETEADAEEAPAQTRPAAPMPGPVYATVSVGPYTPPAKSAPPHPAEAPASAGGLSGESIGPDHEDGEEAYASGADDADLDPAMVAGPEAPDMFTEEPMPAEGRGDWVYTANLAVGLGLTGYGGWDLVSNLDAYLSAGLDFSLIGPVAFGAGVLLSAASGWYVVGAMGRRNKR